MQANLFGAWNLRARGAFFCLGLLHLTPAWSQPVRIQSGLLEGVREGQIMVYRSVPYAAAPVGELRWRAPAPPPRWAGVRKADAFGPICMQSGASAPGAPAEPVSEDCLTLSIWAPARSGAEKLAVMVWIPGGGFTQESGSMPLYWGNNLAGRGVIVVTINYRVGVFGFLAHPELTREAPYRASGNYGLLDQIAALKWVKRNIAAFGGDSHRVTIWGQSAGAMSVNLLMASPLARGLFQRAIGESGAFFAPAAATGDPAGWTLGGAEQQGLKFATAAAAPSVEALRKLPPAQLLKSASAGTTHPIIDGYVLPREPYEAFSLRKQNDVPLLAGSNADEAKPLLGRANVSLKTFGADVAKAFHSDVLGDLATAYLSTYPASNDEQAREVRAKLERDLRFGWDVWTWARMQASHGKGKVFYYHFSHTPPFPPGSPFSEWGAGHWQELRYVFDALGQEKWEWTRTDHALADSMAGYWTNFAKRGDPNGENLPDWPRFAAEGGRLMQFGTRIEATGVPNLEGLRVFEDFYKRLRAAAKPGPR
jgi:para-nitrobenzyl esterase